MAASASYPLPIPEDFWLRASVQEALKTRDMGRFFHLVRQYTGASQTKIGLAVRLEQGYVSKVINHEREIEKIDVFERIASGTGMPDPIRILMGLAPMSGHTWHDSMAAADIATDNEAESTIHVVTASLSTTEGGEPSYLYGGARRTAASDRELIQMAAQRAKRFSLFSRNGLPSGALDQVYDDIKQLAIYYPQRPLSEILGDLVEAQDNAFGLLEQRQRPGEARQLYLFAGITGGLLAKASHDLTEPHAAMTQARAAFVCAETAGHDGLCAWLRGLQSLIAYWAGNFQTSLSYAQDGARYVQNGRGTSSVWLPMNEGRAWAALGNAVEARRAIERAETAWDIVQPDELDELGGICTFGRARGFYYAAEALAWLPGEAGLAQDYATRAVEAYRDSASSEWAFGDQAGSHTDLVYRACKAGRIGRRPRGIGSRARASGAAANEWHCQIRQECFWRDSPISAIWRTSCPGHTRGNRGIRRPATL